MKPGESIYIQTKVDVIFGNFLQRDIYTEIHMDEHGNIETSFVTPGGG